MKARRRKVVIYCIDRDRLLVLRHPDHSPDAVGLQVPGGSIRDGEDPRAAALRELREETGRQDFEILGDLGEAEYDITPHRFEIQHRVFFLARPTAPLPERWPAIEDHDGLEPPTRLECFWIPLTDAHVLQSGQGALIGRLFPDDDASAA
ncbi:NUDIX domain-containing protein [Caulobacter sp. CCG-8]|uniref:NUDIX hydrolase n=1 Tax=Caulobacter sp. CCG-8 TaxID=3127958 RepID=UPI00307D60C7